MVILIRQNTKNLDAIADGSVHCVVTSPPYWGLRKYAGEQEMLWPDGSRSAYGLEPTIEQYVEHTLVILREVRRVLRDDGVCWWNIGSSYASGNGHSEFSTINDADAAWLACLLEGEGSFYIHVQRTPGRKDCYQANLRVGMTNPQHVRRAKEITGVGYFFDGKSSREGRPVYEWNVRGPEVVPIIRRIYPWMLSKRKQARILCELVRHIQDNDFRNGNPMTAEAESYRANLSDQCKALNSASDIDIDVPEINALSFGAAVKPLDLCLIPERVALAAQSDGWYVRSLVIWAKPNPMPESVNGWRWERHRVKVKARGYRPEPMEAGQPSNVEGRTDQAQWSDCPGCAKCSPNDGLVLRKGSWRPTDAYEHIIMLTKTADYFGDAEAVKEASVGTWNSSKSALAAHGVKNIELNVSGQRRTAGADTFHPNIEQNGRNLRNVWQFPTQPYRGAHFATFPERLPEICIKASTSERGCCPKCGAGWVRVIRRSGTYRDQPGRSESSDPSGGDLLRNDSETWGGRVGDGVPSETVGWRPSCSCNAGEPVPCMVLDPFCGSGTTGKVAHKLGRDFIGCDISSEYLELAKKRIGDAGADVDVLDVMEVTA